MKKNKILTKIAILSASLVLSSCGTGNGFTNVDYTVTERDRYDNIFRENIPNQWENYGIGDPFLMRWNGEYYLFVSTKDNNPGYRCWKSHNLVQFEYLGQYALYNRDGVTENGQYGQYAPEVYYWNGNFYMYGSPSGNGHFIYKSTTGLPYGDYVAITGNFGLSIDGSVFIDDDESMTFMVAGNGAIKAYEMESMEYVDPYSGVDLLSPLVNWTEGPCMVKVDNTYYLTYTGNHVKSKGYRVDYSYSQTDPYSGFKYPINNSIALKSLDEQNGLGHSSTVLGPNLDSYYMSYHSLDDSSGPIRSYNINRLSFQHNRMSMYGPTRSGAQVPVLPDFVDYDGSKLTNNGSIVVTNEKTEDRFSVEYNFKNINGDNSNKLVFGYTDGQAKNYITFGDHAIYLYIDGTLKGQGELKHDFDFSVLHSVRLNVEKGHYRVYFDNMKKIEVEDAGVISGGYVGYAGISEYGTTTFTNDAFNSSDRTDAKIVNGDWFATSYLEESKLSLDKGSGVIEIEEDEVDSEDTIYSDSAAVKLANVGDYLLYPIDVLEDGRYGLETLHSKISSEKQVILSVQVDNEPAKLFELKPEEFLGNSNRFEQNLQYIKSFDAEIELTKGVHTLKIELVKGEVSLTYFNLFKDSKYSPDYSNDLSTYVNNGASYLSLWKLVEDEGRIVHKAKAGVNNMIIFGDQSMTDYEVSVDIKVSVSSGNNSKVGMIVRCNNPSLYSGYSDESAQGYLVTFNRIQLVEERINYNTSTVNVKTGRNYSMNEWHNLKVVCKGAKTTTYFDGELAFTYIDPYPFSHGLVALYSINSESFYKNLSIKGI